MKNLIEDPKDLVLQSYGVFGWDDVKKFRRSKFDDAKTACENLHQKSRRLRTRVILRIDPMTEIRVYPYQKDKSGQIIIFDLSVNAAKGQ